MRELNNKPHRKENIRSLIPYILIKGDKPLVKAYTKGIRSFPKHLPFNYEHEKEDSRIRGRTKGADETLREQGDPKYWKSRQSQDGKHIEVYNDPPSLKTPKYVAQQQQHVQLNEASGVALWAQKSLEEGKPEARLSAVDGVAKARQSDNPDLFDVRDADVRREAARLGCERRSVRRSALYH